MLLPENIFVSIYTLVFEHVVGLSAIVFQMALFKMGEFIHYLPMEAPLYLTKFHKLLQTERILGTFGYEAKTYTVCRYWMFQHVI